MFLNNQIPMNETRGHEHRQSLNMGASATLTRLNESRSQEGIKTLADSKKVGDGSKAFFPMPTKSSKAARVVVDRANEEKVAFDTGAKGMIAEVVYDSLWIDDSVKNAHEEGIKNGVVAAVGVLVDGGVSFDSMLVSSNPVVRTIAEGISSGTPDADASKTVSVEVKRRVKRMFVQERDIANARKAMSSQPSRRRSPPSLWEGINKFVATRAANDGTTLEGEKLIGEATIVYTILETLGAFDLINTSPNSLQKAAHSLCSFKREIRRDT